MADRSFWDALYDAFLYGGTAAAIIYGTLYIVIKTDNDDYDIKELFSRLEECEKKHESSQDHGLKK